MILGSQRQWRISSTAVLLTEDGTLTMYKLFTNLYEQINFRTVVRFRQNKTKQIKQERLNDSDDSSYNHSSNNKNNANNNNNDDDDDDDDDNNNNNNELKC